MIVNKLSDMYTKIDIRIKEISQSFDDLANSNAGAFEDLSTKNDVISGLLHHALSIKENHEKTSKLQFELQLLHEKFHTGMQCTF